MESKLFSIGDIVTLNAHPYTPESTGIVISGDHMMLPPLMVVTEVYTAKQLFTGEKTQTYKYKCAWFSPKLYKFIYVEIDEIDLKAIVKCTSYINKHLLKRGDKIIFKTAGIELGKKKSSLTYEDNSLNAGVGNTVINSLLSFLPPVLQVVDYESHITKHALTNKEKKRIRDVSAADIKFTFFDPTTDKVVTHVLPLEALELVEEVSSELISKITKCISNSGYLNFKKLKVETLCKPRNIAYRGGYYFLRAFDYLSNKVEEFEINESSTFNIIKQPFIEEAPKFDIRINSNAATSISITNEILNLIKRAATNSYFIRIKYKNRNDQLSHRSIMNFELVEAKGDSSDVIYLVGHCLLRRDLRYFRIDRIQNVQMLELKFL